MNCRRLISGGVHLFRQMCTAATKLPESRTRHSPNEVSLRRKLLSLHVTGRTVSQTLDRFIMEGKILSKHQLHRCARDLRKYRHFHNALEIMQWMEHSGVTFSATDFTLYLDLVSLTRGTDVAEIYVRDLPPLAKNTFSYVVLLNGYCRELKEDKALACFENMNELNYVTNGLPFNSLMRLYMRLGRPEKVPPLIDNMKQREIPLTAPSYIIWMNSCASLNDIEGVERVFEEMKENVEDQIQWRTYRNLAGIFVKAKHFEEAESALKMLEKKATTKECKTHRFLLELYATTGNRSEVYRVWNYLKSFPRVSKKSYLKMLQSLRRLNDIEGITKCFEEWKSNCITHDMRVVFTVVRAYLDHDLCEEALSVSVEAIKRRQGKGLFLKTHEMFILIYLGKRKEDLAVHHLESALSEARDYDGWSPSMEVISAFLKYYKKENIDGVEKLRQIFKNCNFDDSCLRNYTDIDKSALGLHQILKKESEISQGREDLPADVHSDE